MARYWLGQHPAMERNTGSALRDVEYRVENVDGTATLVVYDDDTGSTVISSVGTTNHFGEPEGWVEPASGRIRYFPDSENEKIEYFVAPGAGGGGGGTPYTEVTTKGDLLAGTGAGAVARVGIPSGGTNRSVPVSDATQTSGVRWSAKAAPYNVIEAGADPTGASSASSAFTTALNAAAGNGKLFVPPGIFTMTSGIAPLSETFMYGAGPGQSIIRAADTLPNTAMVLAAGSGLHDITLEGLEFDGNKTARFATGGAAVWDVDYGSGLDANGHSETMAGMVGHQGTSGGANATRIVIRDCALHDSPGLGFSFQYVSEVTVINNRVWSNYRDGITLGNRVIKCAVIDNHVRDCGDDHIAISSGSAQQSYDNVVVGNTVGPHGMTHSGHGIAFYAPQNTVCVGNTVRGGHARGIVVLGTQGGGTSTNNVLIAGNTLTLPGGSNPTYGSGIELLATAGAITDVSIHNNIIRTPLSHGIRVEGVSGSNCRWIDISDNQIIGASTLGLSTGHGINLVAYANDVRMSNNLIREFYGRGIYHGPTGIARTEITGGRIENCCKTGGGAAIALGATNDVTLSGGIRVLDNQGTPTQTGAVEWGTSARVFIDGCNFYLCSASATFTGSQPATANLGTYVDRAGVMQGGGGGSADLTGTVNVEEIQDSVYRESPVTVSGTRVPVLVAKFPMRIMAASIASSFTAITANDTNYWSVTIDRRRNASGASVIATKTTQTATPNEGVAGAVDWEFDGVTFANGVGQNGRLELGDIVEFRFTKVGTPPGAAPAFENFVATVRYEPL